MKKRVEPYNLTVTLQNSLTLFKRQPKKAVITVNNNAAQHLLVLNASVNKLHTGVMQEQHRPEIAKINKLWQQFTSLPAGTQVRTCAIYNLLYIVYYW